MDDIVFVKVIERYEDLNGESLDQVKRKALKMIHFNELIQIHGQHLESYH